MAVLSYKQMYAYNVAAGFLGTDAITMTAIDQAESSGNTTAINPIPCVGIAQINVKAHPEYTATQMFDPAANAQAAHKIWQAQGFSAWTTYTSGTYKRYLAGATAAASGGATASAPGGLLNPINGGHALGTGINAYQAIDTLAGQVDNPLFWARVLFILAGIVMVGMGILSMSKTAITSGVKTATKIAEVIPK